MAQGGEMELVRKCDALTARMDLDLHALSAGMSGNILDAYSGIIDREKEILKDIKDRLTTMGLVEGGYHG